MPVLNLCFVKAIEDVIKNYPVNAAEIILAGFSMGGYGAYRIYYEYPAMFKGIAVFSGHPNLATKWLGEGYPDFLNPVYLKIFRDTPSASLAPVTPAIADFE